MKMNDETLAHTPQKAIPLKTVGNFLLERQRVTHFGFEEMVASSLLKGVVQNAVMHKEFTTSQEVKRQLSEKELIQELVDKHYK